MKTATAKKCSATKECKCREQVNKQLSEKFGAGLTCKTVVNFKTGKMRPSPPLLMVDNDDPKSRKPLPTIMCAYCPFCGKKYPK